MAKHKHLKNKNKSAPHAPKPIVIVGCGFAGTSVLLHTLLRVADDQTLKAPVEIQILERKEKQKHAGLAYGKAPEYKKHNLNIGAKRVTPFAAGQKPDGFPTFVEYIQDLSKKDPTMSVCLTNPPRQMFGDYLQHLVSLAVEKAGSKAKVSYVMRRATGVEERPDGTTVTLEDGGKIDAQHVVLATGFQDALAPKFAKAAAKSKHFLETPYAQHSNAFFDKVCADKSSNVLIIGTGLTAMDIAARLLDSGHKGNITMMSRRGLMHKPYGDTPVSEYVAAKLRGEPRPEADLPFTKTPPKFTGEFTTQGALKAMQKEFKQLTSQGFTSEEIITYWERYLPEMAARLPRSETAALLTKHDVLLTTARVGVTPETGHRVQNAILSGRINVQSGTIHDVREQDGQMMCSYSPTKQTLIAKFMDALNIPHTPPVKTAVHDYIFSGMGNSTSLDPARTDIKDPLWKDLLDCGKATPHWTKSGVTVTNGFALVDHKGKASNGISVIGVPVAGHMIVTAYKYPERPGAGGRIGPTALNVVGITGATLAFLDQNYDRITANARSAAQTPANNFKKVKPQQSGGLKA